MQTTPSSGLTEHVLESAGQRKRYRSSAVRALLEAHRLLGLVFGAEIAERRESDDPVQRSFGEAKLNDVLLRAYQEVAAILGEHLDKVHLSRRPHFTPELRFRILKVQSFLGMSQSEIARLFRLSPSTLARWRAEAAREPDKNTIGSLVQPAPPVRRFADVVRSLVQSMAVSGFGGNQRIANTLARAGWRLSRETVRRIRKERPTPAAPSPSRTSRTLSAKRPNHVWLVDITTIPTWFRLFAFKLVVVLDAFSRRPLAWKTFWLEPSSCNVRTVVASAIRRRGTPVHLVTDRGRQFTATSFRKWLRRVGVRQRIGAIGKTGSIAIIERFWRTLKELLGLPLSPPMLRSELDRRLPYLAAA